MADSPRISDESIDVANRLSAIAFPEMLKHGMKLIIGLIFIEVLL
jgi:hypothetical protein